MGRLLRNTRRMAQMPWANELCEVWHATRKMCACVRTVMWYLYTPSRLSGSEICEEKTNTADECARLQEGIRTHVGSGNSRNSIRPQRVSLSQSDHESVVVRSYHLYHHFWSCHWELHHVELSVHVEDEDDEKCCCQLKLNHSKCFWTKIQCVVLSCPQV